MNTESIENNQVRIFPFYKDTYLGRSPIGYTDRKSARKFMMNISPSIVYNEYYGSQEQYNRTHGYFRTLMDKSQGFPYVRQYYPDYKLFNYSLDNNSRIYTSTFTDEQYNDMLEMLGSIKLHSGENIELAIEFEEKYGLFPYMYIDDKDYKKLYTKFITDNVDFRRVFLILMSDGLTEL